MRNIRACGRLRRSALLLSLVGCSLMCHAAPGVSAEADTARVAFYSDLGYNSEIFVINIDGAGLRRLTTNSARDQSPAFSRDGSRIAFSSERDGNWELYVMEEGGGNPVRLTNTAYFELHADWSPADTCIVFARYFTGMGIDGEIFSVRPDGSGERRLTDNPANDSRPLWSADGSKIIFNSKRDGNFEIYTMNPDGSDQRRLTNTPGAELFPRFSPDGSKIAYALINMQTLTGEIHVMNADGTGDVVLTNAGGVSENPAWSPDGEKIVFQTNRSGNFEIFIMNADGSGQTNLTNSANNDYWPSWGIAAPVSVEKRSWGAVKSRFR